MDKFAETDHQDGTEVGMSNDPDDDQELVLELEEEEQRETKQGNRKTHTETWGKSLKDCQYSL